MRRDEVKELHYITPMENLPSIMKHGLLSHKVAAKVLHQSIAMNEIQKLRAKVVVPQGRPLHEYANLYFCARNPMMLKRSHAHLSICVLRIDSSVLDLDGAVVSDSNAASKYASFRAAPDGVKIVDKNVTFADDWRDADKIQFWRKQAAKCAEVLVPDRVSPKHIHGAYVSCEAAQKTFDGYKTGLTATIKPKMFFQ